MPVRLTNGGEIAAFILARAISVVAFYVVYRMFFAAVYVQLYRSGGMAAAMAASLGLGLVGWLLTLLLLVLFRAGFAGVPPTVAADSRAVTTSSSEVGAFFLAYLAVTVTVTLFNMWVVAGFYRWLAAHGAAGSAILVSFGVSAVSAVIFFLIFIAVRNAMAGPAPRGDPVGPGWG